MASRGVSERGKVIPLTGHRKMRKDAREEWFNKAFGARLKTWRESRELSQERMAAYLGIGKDQYKKYEYGDRSFPLYLLPVLRRVTDRGVAEWLQSLEPPTHLR